VTRYVLDTNVVSALMRGEAAVLARLAGCEIHDVAVPEPAWAEMTYGIERLPRSRRREALAGKLARWRATLPHAAWDEAVTDRFGDVKARLERAGRRIEDFDAAIAAHALALGATLVTANVDDMARVPGLRVEDWSG
jgi:tRNA(fMet)-specific endonuclease VapC